MGERRHLTPDPSRRKQHDGEGDVPTANQTTSNATTNKQQEEQQEGRSMCRETFSGRRYEAGTAELCEAMA